MCMVTCGVDEVSRRHRSMGCVCRSMDDPFTLYAAMHSGPNTMIVTRDELRDHKFRLGKELADSFLQWQRTQQLVFRGIFVDRENQLYLSFRVRVLLSVITDEVCANFKFTCRVLANDCLFA